jgi:excisionase family DNA binding protein
MVNVRTLSLHAWLACRRAAARTERRTLLAPAGIGLNLKNSKGFLMDEKPGIVEAYMTTSEAATYLHLSRSFLYEEMGAGKLRYAKFGNARRIPRQAVLDYEAACLVTRDES